MRGTARPSRSHLRILVLKYIDFLKLLSQNARTAFDSYRSWQSHTGRISGRRERLLARRMARQRLYVDVSSWRSQLLALSLALLYYLVDFGGGFVEYFLSRVARVSVLNLALYA
eukprot:SAG31_NODE_65_length_28565_cov_8.402914_28_plen_114_part_00